MRSTSGKSFSKPGTLPGKRNARCPVSFVMYRLLRVRPRCCDKVSADTAQSSVLRLRPAPPLPFSRCSGHETDTERVASVPESITSLFEIRSLQINPNLRAGIRVRSDLFGPQRDFYFLPDMNIGG